MRYRWRGVTGGCSRISSNASAQLTRDVSMLTIIFSSKTINVRSSLRVSHKQDCNISHIQ